MFTADLRFHPKYLQLGLSFNRTTTQPPGIYQQRHTILMLHFLVFTVDLEVYSTWLKDNPP